MADTDHMTHDEIRAGLAIIARDGQCLRTIEAMYALSHDNPVSVGDFARAYAAIGDIVVQAIHAARMRNGRV